ncbi:MAG: polysaccharide deacetylase family protein [Flavobacteriales bacterium]
MTNQELLDIFYACNEWEGATDSYGRYIPEQKGEFYSHAWVSEKIHSMGFNPGYPNDKKFGVCVTHDVDLLYNNGWSLASYAKQQAKAALRFNKDKWKYNRYYGRRNRNTEYTLNNTFSAYGEVPVKGTFFFLSLNKGEEDFNYQTDEIKDQFQLVKENHAEIGLHGGHTAYTNVEKQQSEKKSLEKSIFQPVVGYRNHYLRFKPGKTWEELEKSGFSYDSTFGHASVTGFRNGICYPFYGFNSARAKLNITVLPLMVMDTTLFVYMKLNPASAFEHVKSVIDEVIKNKGVFVLLWHNNYMKTPYVEVFREIIQYCENNKAWFATCNEMAQHYQKMGYTSQIQDFIDTLK